MKISTVGLLASAVCFLPGIASAANLIPNGNFSLGNAQFSSDYAFSAFTACGNTVENQYTVGTDPRVWNCGAVVVSVGDHTTGTGNMLIANGGNTGLRVWFTSAPIAVTPNTTYFFEAWLLNWSTTSVGSEAAQLTFRANGMDLLTASATGVGTWTPVSAMWNSGASTTVSLELFDNTPTLIGNDFAVDDISFDTVSSIQTPTPTPTVPAPTATPTLAPPTATLTPAGGPSPSVPTLSGGVLALFGVALGAAALFLLRWR